MKVKGDQIVKHSNRSVGTNKIHTKFIFFKLTEKVLINYNSKFTML